MSYNTNLAEEWWPIVFCVSLFPQRLLMNTQAFPQVRRWWRIVMMDSPTEVTGPNTQEPREKTFFTNKSNGRVARESLKLDSKVPQQPFRSNEWMEKCIHMLPKNARARGNVPSHTTLTTPRHSEKTIHPKAYAQRAETRTWSNLIIGTILLS
jgi:hypothetical protein